MVLYDTVGVFSAPRGMFTFKGELWRCCAELTSAFGHDKVSVLNGGLPAWIDEGCEVEEGAPESFKVTEYTGGQLNKSMVKSESS